MPPVSKSAATWMWTMRKGKSSATAMPGDRVSFEVDG